MAGRALRDRIQRGVTAIAVTDGIATVIAALPSIEPTAATTRVVPRATAVTVAPVPLPATVAIPGSSLAR
ncbi:MAG: hypothetical protein R2882_08110 [Gemmatimonadales bacterium]